MFVSGTNGVPSAPVTMIEDVPIAPQCEKSSASDLPSRFVSMSSMYTVTVSAAAPAVTVVARGV